MTWCIANVIGKHMPGTASIAWVRVLMFWSSMALRVSTLTDCGMSLSFCVPLPMVTAPVV